MGLKKLTAMVAQFDKTHAPEIKKANIENQKWYLDDQERKIKDRMYPVMFPSNPARRLSETDYKFLDECRQELAAIRELRKELI